MNPSGNFRILKVVNDGQYRVTFTSEGPYCEVWVPETASRRGHYRMCNYRVKERVIARLAQRHTPSNS